MNYREYVFGLVRPPSQLISVRILKNKSQHQAMLAEAIEQGLLLYSAQAEWRDKQCFAKQPWVLDMESVQLGREPAKQETPAQGLSCPICGKVMGTTSGRTLHVKNKHPDKYETYLQSLK